MSENNKTAKGIAFQHFDNLYRVVQNECFSKLYYKYTTIDYFPQTPDIKDINQFFEENLDSIDKITEEKLNMYKALKKIYL